MSEKEENIQTEDIDLNQSEEINNETDDITEDENQKEVEEVDYKTMYIRLLADFDNYRKRSLDSISTARTDGVIDCLSEIIPSLDGFEQAVTMITDKNSLIGVQYIQKNILSALENMGVNRIDATKTFDPNLHNAVSTDETADAESGEIVKELLPGYKYKEKVIRYSQVIVKK